MKCMYNKSNNFPTFILSILKLSFCCSDSAPVLSEQPLPQYCHRNRGALFTIIDPNQIIWSESIHENGISFMIKTK